MASNLKISSEAANAACDAVAALLDDGYIRIYDGSQPTSADTAVGSQNLLAELRFDSTAFSGAVDGVAAARTIVGEDSALYASTATWFRALKSDGSSEVLDGSVGTSNCDLNLSSTSIQVGVLVSVDSCTLTMPKS